MKILLQLSNKQQQQKYEGRLERALFFVLIHLHRGRDIIKTGQANKADIKDCTSTQIQNDKNYKEGYLKEHDSITWRSFRDGKADLKIIESENFDFLTEVSEKDSDFNSGRSFASLRMTDASGKWRGRSGDSGKILFHSNL